MSEHHDFGGLTDDLIRTGSALSRRRILQLGFGSGVLTLLGRSPLIDACTAIPGETPGPFPGNGTNGPNVLNQVGVVRRDIRSSFAGLSGTADGVGLTVTLKVVDVDNNCTPLAGYAVYLWQCDRVGRYSLYSPGATDQNYLRGVQATDARGEVTFTTVFPGCYVGRWPHIHFEVFRSLEGATTAGNKLITSQLAFPENTCKQVYAKASYAESAKALARVSLATDGIFRDGVEHQMAAMSGNAATGYSATLEVGV